MYTLSGRINKKIKVWLLFVLGVCLCILTGGICYSAEAANHIVINEVCSNNFSVKADENGNYSDYVEIYNPAIIPVSLTGFSLSDNENELKKCLLDSVILPAKGYMLIWLDGTDSDIVGHASFRISSAGEDIYLSNKHGVIIDSVKVPGMSYNTAFAREEDGSSTWYRQVPTAGKANETGEILPLIELEKPEFSIKSGFFGEPFQLEIKADRNEIIYYTLDGSEPTTSSFIYKEPITISDASFNDNIYSARTDLMADMEYIPAFKVDKATVIRAVASTKDGTRVSETVTEIYFVGFNEKRDYDGYPILALITDPDNLFDPEIGIYGNGNALKEYEEAAGFVDGEIPDVFTDEEGDTNYRYMSTNAYNAGKEWEREASLIYFDENHEESLRQKAGIRIAGQSTRNASQKSFNLYARDIYDGQKTFSYNFFEDMEYSSVKLRNGGTDHQRSKIYDPFLQSLAEGRDVSVQASKPCVVFLNGEYWGIYNVRER